ncbi:hypothetical protein PIB30_048522 [Stylosanthes scabra]|uniref:Uncharacterized protein n=1 Tax=Stylosanthes scabra TaxID=79078 RepID=A0ABU6YFV6_9FABA|nr:hypothetical protein [Stylosanthes scabra]
MANAARQYVGGVEVCHFAQRGGCWLNVSETSGLPTVESFSFIQFKFKIFWVDSDAHVRAMFELHRRYGSRDVMELLTKMQNVNVDAGGSTSSSRGGPSAIIAALIQFTTTEVGDNDSDEDFVANTDESSESSDGSEFVPESQTRQGFFASSTKPDTRFVIRWQPFSHVKPG